MNNNILQVKVKQRLNKLDSKDYDNIQCWQIVEAFNKAQVEWCRRQLVGSNILKQGDEQSKRRVDDLQSLLKPVSLTLLHVNLYDESSQLPADYFAFKRLEVYATSECCKDPRLMTVYLTEDANVVNDLKDDNKKPSFEWGETFNTIVGGKIRIYTNNDFQISSAVMTYYKQPIQIQVLNCVDPNTGVASTVDVPSQLKDDVVEVIIDDAVAILAGDIEAMNQRAREQEAAEKDN